jgi:RNA-binding protein Luc7-like 2
MDLGQCPHTHSGKLKSEYDAAIKAALDPTSTAEMKYTLQDLVSIRNEYERNILAFVDECDRRIRAAQRRLEKTPEENNKTTSLVRLPNLPLV